jgi:hypothetical protein
MAAIGIWRCNNWRTASGGFDSRPVPLATELVLQIQRCDGFNARQFKRLAITEE